MPSNKKWRRDQWKHLAIVIVLLVGLVVGVFSYAKYRETSELLATTFHNADGSNETKKIFLTISSTPSERKNGLMYVKEGELKPDRGMLFIFPREQINSFWMKNTYISLDMIFINQKNEVVGIIENVPPLTSESRKVNKPSTYVVELNGGASSKLGIKEGMLVKFHGKTPKPI